MEIYCSSCKRKIVARLTNGVEVYPHRSDLKNLPFWICDKCHNFVGCHYKTKDRTRPLGIIADKELKSARIKIHDLIDPLWRNTSTTRTKIYKRISDKLGYNYHTAFIRSINDARKVYAIGLEIRQEQEEARSKNK